MGRQQQTDFDKATEHNKKVIATYSRDKLVEICNKVGMTFGDSHEAPEDQSDEELRKFVLALSQGI